MRLPDPRERPWLSVAEVSEITGEGQKAIRAAIANGQLTGLRIGRYVRVPTAALWVLLQIPEDPGVGLPVPAPGTAEPRSETPEATAMRPRRVNRCRGPGGR